jgi:hypothetical protein
VKTSPDANGPFSLPKCREIVALLEGFAESCSLSQSSTIGAELRICAYRFNSVSSRMSDLNPRLAKILWIGNRYRRRTPSAPPLKQRKPAVLLQSERLNLTILHHFSIIYTTF